MTYKRNYRKSYYRRQSYRKPGRSFEPITGIYILGIAFILLRSTSSISKGNFMAIFGNILIWTLIFGSIVLIIRKIKNRTQKTGTNDLSITANEDPKQIKLINSQKHGCKCYMEGLTEGEQEIAHILAENLSYKDYFIFNNLIIPSDHNGSSQIDHLVVSKFGIFVIESKDYKGWIFGSKDQDTWTQSLPGGANKFQFQNPIRQNWSHIMSLKPLLPTIPENAYLGLVVFTDSCEFKTDPIENVVHSEDVIGQIQKHTEIKLSEDNIHMILGKLSYVCQTADISAVQHVDNLLAHYPVPSL